MRRGVEVTGLTKSFGRLVVWFDVTLMLPAGEISVLLGPSGTGESVFLKTATTASALAGSRGCG